MMKFCSAMGLMWFLLMWIPLILDFQIFGEGDQKQRQNAFFKYKLSSYCQTVRCNILFSKKKNGMAPSLHLILNVWRPSVVTLSVCWDGLHSPKHTGGWSNRGCWQWRLLVWMTTSTSASSQVTSLLLCTINAFTVLIVEHCKSNLGWSILSSNTFTGLISYLWTHCRPAKPTFFTYWETHWSDFILSVSLKHHSLYIFWGQNCNSFTNIWKTLCYIRVLLYLCRTLATLMPL